MEMEKDKAREAAKTIAVIEVAKKVFDCSSRQEARIVIDDKGSPEGVSLETLENGSNFFLAFAAGHILAIAARDSQGMIGSMPEGLRMAFALAMAAGASSALCREGIGRNLEESDKACKAGIAMVEDLLGVELLPPNLRTLFGDSPDIRGKGTDDLRKENEALRRQNESLRFALDSIGRKEEA